MADAAVGIATAVTPKEFGPDHRTRDVFAPGAAKIEAVPSADAQLFPSTPEIASQVEVEGS
jgi:hypothetical protein